MLNSTHSLMRVCVCSPCKRGKESDENWKFNIYARKPRISREAEDEISAKCLHRAPSPHTRLCNEKNEYWKAEQNRRKEMNNLLQKVILPTNPCRKCEERERKRIEALAQPSRTRWKILDVRIVSHNEDLDCYWKPLDLLNNAHKDSQRKRSEKNV